MSKVSWVDGRERHISLKKKEKFVLKVGTGTFTTFITTCTKGSLETVSLEEMGFTWMVQSLQWKETLCTCNTVVGLLYKDYAWLGSQFIWWTCNRLETNDFTWHCGVPPSLMPDLIPSQSNRKLKWPGDATAPASSPSSVVSWGHSYWHFPWVFSPSLSPGFSQGLNAQLQYWGFLSFPSHSIPQLNSLFSIISSFLIFGLFPHLHAALLQ